MSSEYSKPELTKKFYTASEVARLFDLSTTTISRSIRRGEIKALQIGRVFRVPASEVERLHGAWATRAR